MATKKKSIWEGNGLPDTEEALEYCYALDFLPIELLAVVDCLRREAWVWEHVAPGHKDPAGCLEMAEYFKRRAVKFTELASLVDADTDKDDDEDEDEDE